MTTIKTCGPLHSFLPLSIQAENILVSFRPWHAMGIGAQGGMHGCLRYGVLAGSHGDTGPAVAGRAPAVAVMADSPGEFVPPVVGGELCQRLYRPRGRCICKCSGSSSRCARSWSGSLRAGSQAQEAQLETCLSWGAGFGGWSVWQSGAVSGPSPGEMGQEHKG